MNTIQILFILKIIGIILFFVLIGIYNHWSDIKRENQFIKKREDRILKNISLEKEENNNTIKDLKSKENNNTIKDIKSKLNNIELPNLEPKLNKSRFSILELN